MDDAVTKDTPGAATDPTANVDTSGVSYSVHVPKPLPDAKLDGTGGYFRIGAVDKDQEKGLPAKPTTSQKDPPTTTDDKGNAKPQSDSPFKDGILLYSTGPYQCIAEKVQTTTSSSLTTLVNGSKVAMAQSHEAAGVNTTFQVVDAVTASMGNITTSMVGSQFTHTAVNNATVSTVGRLVSNLGGTVNVFGGTVVNVSGRGVAVQGAGQYSNFKNYQLCSVKNITFVADAASTDLAIASADAWVTRLHLATTLLNLVATGATVVIGSIIASQGSATSTDDIKLKLSELHFTFDAATALVMVAQLGVLLVGAVLQKTKFPTDVIGKPTVEIKNDGIILRIGNSSISLVEDSITIKGTKVSVVAAEPPVGGVPLPVLVPPSATISLEYETAAGITRSATLDSNGVTLKVGNPVTTSLALTAATAVTTVATSSITLAADGIDVAAAAARHLLFKPNYQGLQPPTPNVVRL